MTNERAREQERAEGGKGRMKGNVKAKVETSAVGAESGSRNFGLRSEKEEKVFCFLNFMGYLSHG